MESNGFVANTLLTLALFAGMGTGCSNDGAAPGDPTDPSALGLAVAVRTDPATFQQTGEFTLELIPSTPLGVSLVDKTWSISTTISSSDAISPSLISQEVQPPDTTSVSAALLIDNSASMRTNDPDRRRVEAAQLVWNSVLAQPMAQASLLYFGLGTNPPTPGFTATRLLRNWTSEQVSLVKPLDTLHVGGGSQIYTSVLDVVRWIDTTTAPNRHRAIVLLTDGILHLETDASASAALAAAQAAHVSIFPVGLGPASDRSDQTNLEAVGLLQELANGSQGIYAGAATPERLSSTLVSLAGSISATTLIARFKLVPIPPTGTQVAGTVKLTNEQLGDAQGTWSFVAP
jgi:hypothetical protein